MPGEVSKSEAVKLIPHPTFVEVSRDAGGIGWATVYLVEIGVITDVADPTIGVIPLTMYCELLSLELENLTI